VQKKTGSARRNTITTQRFGVLRHEKFSKLGVVEKDCGTLQVDGCWVGVVLYT
jgi:hypothetical protein